MLWMLWTVVWAQGPRDFGDAFPGVVCADGWAACHVDGVPVEGAVGRVDWNGLTASAVFSPFVELDRLPRGTDRPAVQAVAKVAVPVAPAAPPPAQVVDSPRVTPREAVVEPLDEPLQPTPEAAAVVVGCDIGPALELEAQAGALGADTRACLEDRITTASRMTDRRQASLVLMADAVARGEETRWEDLARRHLEQIDGSDPDVAMRMARWLSRGGQSLAAHRMADLALENAHVWTGETFRQRRASLLKLRAVSAQQLWTAAEKEHAVSPSSALQDRIERTRLQTATDAREWAEFLRANGEDDQTATSLCTSASGHACD